MTRTTRTVALLALVMGVLLAIAPSALAKTPKPDDKYPPPAPPNCQVKPDKGEPTDQVVVKGEHWFPNDAQTVYMDGVAVGSATSDDKGKMDGDATVPDTTPGDNSFVVKGRDSSGNPTSCARTFKVEPRPEGGKPECHVKPNHGASGATVELEGKHWDPGTPVDITFDGSAMATGTPVAKHDNDGEFTTSGAIPGSERGSHNIVFKGKNKEGYDASCDVVFKIDRKAAFFETLRTGGGLLGIVVVLTVGTLAILRRRRTGSLWG